jgi:hypothetical protein
MREESTVSIWKTRARTRTLLGVTAVMSLLLALGGTSLVLATHVTPTEVAGNPTCAQLVEGESGEFRLDAKDFGADGTYGDSEFTVDIDFTYNDEDEAVSFDFSNADPDVLAVFVKGGDTGNLYEYDPPADADTGLVAPLGPQGQATGISHISFCYLVPAPTPTPTPTPTPESP